MDLAIFISITALFFLLLVFRWIFDKKFCVLCGSVFLTWVAGLLGHYFAGWDWTPLLAILIGQSALGIYYSFEDRMGTFKLPFLLTITYLAYLLIASFNFNISILILLSVVWIVFAVIDLGKNSKQLGVMAKKVIECCKKW
ncbi:MAG: hypothetical protein ABEH43_04440 [Flavobacteriales bacterium]